MAGKRIGLILLILIILAAPVCIKSEKGVYPVFSNLALLPLGVLVYSEGLFVSLAGIFICAAFFLVYIFRINVDLISVIPTLLAFGLTPVIFKSLRWAAKGLESLLREDRAEAEGRLAAARDRETKIDEELKKLKKNVSETANLYEITKRMSSSLLFGDIFRIFGEFLRGNFKFTACKLILITQGPGPQGIEKIYKIEASSPSVVMPELVDAEILEEIVKTQQVVFWEDFVAIPLMSQDRIIGVLNMEGLTEAALEGFLIVSRQFSLAIEKVLLYETVQELAVTDGLTGMFVRRYFLEMLKEEFERASRHNSKLSFLMIDFDNFKECNDMFGHLAGDVILKEAANILRQNVREIDLLGRYGGEEFAIILPDTDKGGAILAAERLRIFVANRDFKAYDETLKITISVGVATFPDDASTSNDLIECADLALYEAKAQGRNRVSFKRPPKTNKKEG